MPRLRQPVAMKKGERFDSEKAAQLLEEQNKQEEEAQSEPQLEAVAEDTPTKEPVKPPVEELKQDDASLALRKQIEEIRKSEALALRERDEALSKLREQELAKARAERETVKAQYLSVANTLRAAKEKLEFAKRDIKAASDAGDKEAELAAFERFTEAKNEIATLEPGQEELKDKRRSEKKKFRDLRDQYKQEAQPQPQVQTPQAAPHVTEWTKAHSEYFDGGLKQKKLFAAFYQASSEGLEEYSPAMLERMDQILGSKTPSEPARKAPIVSAPVSREVPSGGSGRRVTEQVTLTAEEREFAKISNITEAEYARQKQRLLEAKANGQYTGGQ